jgi:hypothetical protein
MLIKCCVCGKVIGCYIGMKKNECGQNDGCVTARAYELCQNYEGNRVSHGYCDDCAVKMLRSFKKGGRSWKKH